jgi:hypothetical protein
MRGDFVERIEIKRQAKQITAAHRRLFTQMLLIYFCILLFSLLITFVGSYGRFLFNLSPQWLVGLLTTPYTRAIVNILSILLSAPAFLLLNKATYSLLDHKNSTMDFHTVALWIKDKGFLKKALSLGIILCVFTVPVELLGSLLSEYIKIHNVAFAWPWSKLIPLLFSLISVVLIFLVDFLYCIGALYPNKSALWVMRTAIKILAKNFFDYLAFILSFLLWFLIEPAGTIILSLFAKNLADSYTILALGLVFVAPLMMGVGFYFWPYYNVAKAIICKEFAKKEAPAPLRRAIRG